MPARAAIATAETATRVIVFFQFVVIESFMIRLPSPFATNYLVSVAKLALSRSFQSPKSVLREFWLPLDSDLDPAQTRARRRLSKTRAPLLRIARFASRQRFPAMVRAR